MQVVQDERTLAATGFFRLWAGESVSQIGGQVTMFALPLVAVLVLDAGAWEMGLLGAAGSLAVLLFGLSIGVWVDRRDRKAVMQLANLLRCAVLLVVPVLYAFGELRLWMLLAVAFVVGGLSLLFDSAMAGYIPSLVGRTRLVQANSWVQSSVSVSDTAGPGLAGVLIQVLTAPVAIVADALSYLVSMIALHTLPSAPAPPAEREHRHLQAILVGVRLLFRDRVQRPLLLAAAHFNLFTAMFFALYMLYLVKVLGFSPLLIGILTVAGGVAGLAGASVSSRLATRFGYGPVLIVAYALPGLAGLMVPAAESFDAAVPAVLVAASAALWSGAVVINLVLSETIKQALVPEEMLGRATSIIRVVSWGVEPVGALVGGAVATSVFSLRATLVLAAIGVATSALWPLTARVRSLRDLSSHNGPPADAGLEQYA